MQRKYIGGKLYEQGIRNNKCSGRRNNSRKF